MATKEHPNVSTIKLRLYFRQISKIEVDGALIQKDVSISKVTSIEENCLWFEATGNLE